MTRTLGRVFPHSRGLAATLIAALTLGLALVVPTAAAADPTGRGDARPPSAPVSAALGNARAAVTGHAEHDTTLALTRLRLAYPSLSAAERAAADALLARPTDGAADPEQFGYTTAEATPLCGATFCVHYVTTTADAPAAVDVDLDGVPDWVETTLAELEAVVAFETGTLGYRHPATDGVRGGNAQFDVYLSQIGDDGLYGFCAPEEKVPGQRFVYSGYCVLDNDFTEFPLGPLPSLQVTAAHEFFHAIQFDYDATEDRWFMEATATWVEEQYADAIDDNRQYLPYGQLGRPRQPLDEFDSFGQGQYGNWLFIELLSQDFGPDVVRRIWNQADATRGAPDRYSTEAVRRVVSAGQGPDFEDFYARFATVNQLPGRFYTEGAAYRRAPVAQVSRLDDRRRTASHTTRLDHLTSTAYRLEPAGSLHGTWRLRVAVDGPASSTGATATLLLRKRNGGVALRPVHLSKKGDGARSLGFSRSAVTSVTVVLANGSTRFKPCWRGTSYSCQGIPRDDRAAFAVTATLSR